MLNKLLIEVKEGTILSEGLQYHVTNQIPLNENIYRPDSNNFYSLFREARKLLQEGKIENIDPLDRELLETDLGEFGEYNGIRVPLDYPLTEEYLLKEAEYHGKKVQLGKPKRSSGPKKYMVFVKDPKTGNIKKVNFGDVKGGLSAKIHDPKARKAFSDRMNCPAKKDKTTPGWWACNLPKYGRLLGLSQNTNSYW